MLETQRSSGGCSLPAALQALCMLAAPAVHHMQGKPCYSLLAALHKLLSVVFQLSLFSPRNDMSSALLTCMCVLCLQGTVSEEQAALQDELTALKEQHQELQEREAAGQVRHAPHSSCCKHTACLSQLPQPITLCQPARSLCESAHCPSSNRCFV